MWRYAVALLMVSAPATAQERPTHGTVNNTTDWNSLQYDCSMQTSGILNCDFTQISVRRENDGKSAREEIAQAIAGIKTDKMKPEDCAQIEKIATAFKNPSPSAPGYKDIVAMPQKAKDDTLKMMTSLSDYCKSPNEQTASQMARVTLEKQFRTCIVSSNTFSMPFKQVDRSETWTSNVGPTGQCGVVTIARMEPDPKYKMFYNYTQKKVITNPSATVYGTLSCKEMDQNEYNFKWQSREIFAGCDYIKFQ